MLQLLRRSASPALLAGGGLMIAAEVIVWIVGFQTGKLAPKLGMNAPYFLTHIGYLASEVPVLLLGVGLWGMYAQLDGRAKGLGITGVVLATLSMITAVGALAIPGNGSNSLVGAVGGITLVLGTGLLTVASLRAGIVAWLAALTLLCTDALFIPLLFGTPLPFGPDWASDFVAFLVSGIGYAVMGASLRRDYRPTHGTVPVAHMAAVKRQ